MLADFNTRFDMRRHVESRIVPDIDRYARRIVEMGDVFTPDPYGLYHPHTGELMLDFGAGCFYEVRPHNSRAYRVDIQTLDDFDQSQGHIFDQHGRKILDRRSIKQMNLTTEQPLIPKARKAAMGFFTEVLSDVFDHVHVDRDVPDIRDVIYYEEIRENRRIQDILNNLRRDITRDLKDYASRYQFYEMLAYVASKTIIVDVTMDFRIKSYYERFFDEQDRKEQDAEDPMQCYRP